MAEVDPELNAWWEVKGHGVPKNGYSLLTADFLVSVEGVSSIWSCLSFIMLLMFMFTIKGWTTLFQE